MSLNAAFKVNLREGSLSAFAGTGEAGFRGAVRLGRCCGDWDVCGTNRAALLSLTNSHRPPPPLPVQLQATGVPQRLRCSTVPLTLACGLAMAPLSSLTSSKTTASARWLETAPLRRSRGTATMVGAPSLLPPTRQRVGHLVPSCHPISCCRLQRRSGPAASRVPRRERCRVRRVRLHGHLRQRKPAHPQDGWRDGRGHDHRRQRRYGL